MRRSTALQLMLLCMLIAAALRLPNLVETPPGLHYDEAANGILAADIGLRGERPVFISSYTGKEPLFFYLAGSLMRSIGESVFSLRLTSAYIGILTVAVTYWLGCELLGDRRIALMAAALLAISFWHVLFSRLGFRAISQPLVQGIVVAALFRGLRRDSWPWLVIGGVALGLTAYTYLAARAFPIPLALAMLPFLIGQFRRQRWKQIGLFTVVALAVLSPLIIYFIRQPEAFWVRIGQVGPGQLSLATLGESYLRSLEMIFLVGDPYWRFNIPGRPLLNWFWGGLSIVGWLVLVLQYRRLLNDWQRGASLFLILAPFFMLLPTAMAVSDIVPSNLRAIGLAPFLYLLPAIGFIILLASLARSVHRLMARWPGSEQGILFKVQSRTSEPGVIGLFVLLVLMIGSLSTALAYYENWAVREDVYYDSDADLVAAAEYLDQMDKTDDTIYMAAEHYRHPTIAFLSEQYSRIKWLPGSQALVFPADGPASYLFPHNSPLSDWAADYLPAKPEVIGPAGPDGRPNFMVFRLANPIPPTVKNPINANFANQVTVLGYEIGEGVSGDVLPVTLYWQVERPPSADYTPFVHLEDAWRYRWSQVETNAYPAEQWEPGDVVVQRVEVPLQPGMPPGMYRLRIGFFDPASGEQLVRLDEAGRYAGNALSVDEVAVLPGALPKPLPEPPIVLNQQASPHLTLMGYERGAEKVMAGGAVWLALWWKAQASLESMIARIELISPDNLGRILIDTQPVHDTYPFESWSAPQFVIDHLTPRIPATTPPGDYLLSLRLMNAADDTLMTTDLGLLTVEEADRLFTPPKSQFPLSATFGDEIALLGYDLEKIGPRQFNLNFVWQTLTEPSAGYTVFVHVLNQDGTCCVWQQDITPQQGTYPTNLWLAGEVVVDPYAIELPDGLAAGAYPIEIGLYLPESGQRILVKMPGLKDDDALYLRPVEVK